MMAFLTSEQTAMWLADGIDAGDLDGRLWHLRRERDSMLYEDYTARELREEQKQEEQKQEKERLAMRPEDPLFQRDWEWFLKLGTRPKAAACRAVPYCEAPAFSKACVVRTPFFDPHHVMV